MPWNRYVLGYHGCDAGLAACVVAGREELRISTNDHDWLGHGIYFWEDSPQRALRWAAEQSAREPGFIKKPAVLGAVIDIGRCLNLIEVESIELVKQAHARLIRVLGEMGQPVPRNAGKNFGARILDCAVFEALHNVREDEGEPPFDTVRAFFVEGDPLYPTAGIRQLDHVQICVRRTQQILGFFLPR